jgi:hypothetical protein
MLGINVTQAYWIKYRKMRKKKKKRYRDARIHGKIKSSR